MNFPAFNSLSSMELTNAINTKQKAVDWAMQHGLLSSGMTCVCGKVMRLYNSKKAADEQIWRCTNHTACSRTKSIRNGSFYEKCTTIWSDKWAAYANIPRVTGLAHDTVNHRYGFVAPNGVHTNAIENLWKCAKDKFKRMHGTCDDHVSSCLEFMWQRGIKDRDERFQTALELIRTYYPV
ncbi:hypothetical protein HELRODRAFT_174268 [Helobdella robusta]|uniref:ISXO2-like transposase domain-containing protein n=1 Tax=Helobdella robusta TaxID=6412 RepID=T1F7W9_HELRO|nr:hypothetical protein HELRODRAFT_174268 [Helobdella robusta]ESO02839.1 hypothetical protein HELRODRAFT_174268 [Helobdella robusta]